ncbi:Osiris 10, partial [Operophtera brumata]
MSPKSSFIVILSLLMVEVIPIQLQEGEQIVENYVNDSQLNECVSIQRSSELGLQEGEQIVENYVKDSQLNECVSIQRSSELGVCFGKEILNKLNKYDEAETFSLASGISFVRDEKTPRDIGSFLDKDPMDFRVSNEDRTHFSQWSTGIRDGSKGRLLARNLLVPFLLGFKFQISTLLPILLGLLLIASKKAFLLAKVALLAVTVFSGSGFGQSFGGFGGYPGPALSSYSSEKSAEQTTAAPITPDELRDRLE